MLLRYMQTPGSDRIFLVAEYTIQIANNVTSDLANHIEIDDWAIDQTHDGWANHCTETPPAPGAQFQPSSTINLAWYNGEDDWLCHNCNHGYVTLKLPGAYVGIGVSFDGEAFGIFGPKPIYVVWYSKDPPPSDILSTLCSNDPQPTSYDPTAFWQPVADSASPWSFPTTGDNSVGLYIQIQPTVTDPTIFLQVYITDIPQITNVV